MNIAINGIDDEIAVLRERISVLEKAKGMLASEPDTTASAVTSPPPIAPQSQKDLAGKTIYDCAKEILDSLEDNDPDGMSTEEIASEAQQRGYESPRGSSLTSITRSFYDIMRRWPDEFLNIGKGRWRLRSTSSQDIQRVGELTKKLSKK